MRRRINIRDIIWYRDAVEKNGRVYDASPIFRRLSDPIVSAVNPKEAPPGSLNAPTQKSVMDWWEERIGRFFGMGMSRSRLASDPSVRVGGEKSICSEQSKRKPKGRFWCMFGTSPPEAVHHPEPAHPREPQWPLDPEKASDDHISALPQPKEEDITASRRERNRISDRSRLWGLFGRHRDQPTHNNRRSGPMPFLWSTNATTGVGLDTLNTSDVESPTAIGRALNPSESSDSENLASVLANPAQRQPGLMGP